MQEAAIAGRRRSALFGRFEKVNMKAIVGSGVSIKVKFGAENTDGKIDQTVIFPDCGACGHSLHGGGGSEASTRYQK